MRSSLYMISGALFFAYVMIGSVFAAIKPTVTVNAAVWGTVFDYTTNLWALLMQDVKGTLQTLINNQLNARQPIDFYSPIIITANTANFGNGGDPLNLYNRRLLRVIYADNAGNMPEQLVQQDKQLIITPRRPTVLVIGLGGPDVTAAEPVPSFVKSTTTTTTTTTSTIKPTTTVIRR